MDFAVLLAQKRKLMIGELTPEGETPEIRLKQGEKLEMQEKELIQKKTETQEKQEAHAAIFIRVDERIRRYGDLLDYLYDGQKVTSCHQFSEDENKKNNKKKSQYGKWICVLYVQFPDDIDVHQYSSNPQRSKQMALYEVHTIALRELWKTAKYYLMVASRAIDINTLHPLPLTEYMRLRYQIPDTLHQSEFIRCTEKTITVQIPSTDVTRIYQDNNIEEVAKREICFEIIDINDSVCCASKGHFLGRLSDFIFYVSLQEEKTNGKENCQNCVISPGNNEIEGIHQTDFMNKIDELVRQELKPVTVGLYINGDSDDSGGGRSNAYDNFKINVCNSSTNEGLTQEQKDDRIDFEERMGGKSVYCLQCIEESCSCSVASDGIHMYDDQEFDCIRTRFDTIGVKCHAVDTTNEQQPLISIFTDHITIGSVKTNLYETWLPFTKVHHPSNIDIHPAQKHLFLSKKDDHCHLNLKYDNNREVSYNDAAAVPPIPDLGFLCNTNIGISQPNLLLSEVMKFFENENDEVCMDEIMNGVYWMLDEIEEHRRNTFKKFLTTTNTFIYKPKVFLKGYMVKIRHGHSSE